MLGHAPDAPAKRESITCEINLPRTAAAEERPQALIDQLAVGGILIVPVGRDPTAQVVERIVKSESGLQRDTLMPVRFVPLVTGALPVLGQG